jgi:hypothetical protein
VRFLYRREERRDRIGEVGAAFKQRLQRDRCDQALRDVVVVAEVEDGRLPKPDYIFRLT